ncbi:unnamed protein product [Vitrella brassicaformis CCMP3155]|uniref:Secreted protein n=2 Tax=Vitrella brassicaformis TaxID=1169539 RepID=A0A0G4FZ22_VITBC|nr:unnamed protein product [Vitrella brassicaformis CCMP3155]|eukprot:CEM20473.1 unnamed protein product [Vitrella brassicaformis CCMP3155]
MLGLWLLALAAVLVLARCFPTIADTISLKQHVHGDGASFVNAPLVRCSMTPPSRPPLPNTHGGTGPPPLAAFRSGMPFSSAVLCEVFGADGKRRSNMPFSVRVTASTTIEQFEKGAQQSYPR